MKLSEFLDRLDISALFFIVNGLGIISLAAIGIIVFGLVALGVIS